MFWLQSRNVCRFDLWCINHVFTRLTLALSNCLHHSLNYCYDKLPFKIIEKVQLLENVFRGEITLSCSLLPIVLAMPPRLWHSLVIFSIIPTTAKDTQWVFNTDTAPCSEMLLTSEVAFCSANIGNREAACKHFSETLFANEGSMLG